MLLYTTTTTSLPFFCCSPKGTTSNARAYNIHSKMYCAFVSYSKATVIYFRVVGWIRKGFQVEVEVS